MKHIIILSALALCLSVCSMTATAQNVTIHKQGGVGHVYEKEQVDSVVYFPIGDPEEFPAPEEENTNTLWDIILAQPNLTKFAAIMEAATYYSDQFKPTDLNFSQVLNGSTPLNVYAPSDDKISNSLYNKLLDQAQNDGWTLQQEFIANHIAPLESPSFGDNYVTMLNGKKIKKSTINVVSENSEAVGGKLSVISSVLSYTPSMMEYLFEKAPDCDQAQQFLASTDSVFFDAAKSVSVPTMDGSIQILDSVFTRQSRIMEPLFIDDFMMQVEGFGADLANEGANYKMVTPTDEVWNDAQAKLAPHYRYSSIYVDKVKGDMGVTARMTIDKPDSLSDLSMGADILVPLLGRTSSGQKTTLSNGTAYAETAWPVPASEYMPDMEVEIEHSNQDTIAYHPILLDDNGEEYQGYLYSSSHGYGDEIYDERLGKYYFTYDFLFNEEEGRYYYLYYNPDGNITYIPLTLSFVPEIKQTTNVFYNTQGNNYRLGSYSQCLPFNNVRYAEIADKYGRVSNNNFYFLDANNTTNPRVEIKLQGKNGKQVMSGKYDIQIVMVPYWYIQLCEFHYYNIRNEEGNSGDMKYIAHVISRDIPTEWRDPETGQISEQVIDSIANINKQKFRTRIYYNNNSTSDKYYSSYVTTYDGLKVDTITVAEDFEFPFSYKNIPNSYPTLYIEGSTSKSDAKNGYVYGLCIDKIILKSKEDGSETEVTP